MIAIKVGVLSDTHIPWRAKHLPKAVWEGLQGVDLIIHCGDIVAGHVLDELGEIAPVEAVYGNMDPVDLKQKLPKTKVVTVGDFTVGIVHGDGRWRTIDNAFNAFPFTQLDCIVFGHSHIPVITEREGVIDKILTSRELKNRMQKLNMVIGVFFSEIGTELIAFVTDFDGKYEELRGHLQFSTEWKSEDFKRAQEIVRQHRAEVTVDEGDLKNLKNLLHDNRDFLIALLQNPNLLENESFTNLLWALFHMAEECPAVKIWPI